MAISETVMQRIIWLVVTDDDAAAREYATHNLPAGGWLEPLRAAIEVSVDDEFFNWLIHKAPWLLHTTIKRPKEHTTSVDQMIGLIEELLKGREPMTATQLRTELGANRHHLSTVFSDALNKMVSERFLFKASEPTGGRPVTKYALNPIQSPAARNQYNPFEDWRQ